METFVDFAKMLVGDVSVNLGCRNVGVAEKRLDGADIGTVHEKVGGERMS